MRISTSPAVSSASPFVNAPGVRCAAALLGGSLILAAVAGLPLALNGSAEIFTHRTFEDFAAGTRGNAGHNLFVSRKGEIRFINWFDFDNDGHPEVMAVNDHNHYDNVDVLIYSQSRAEGFTSLRAPGAPEMAEFQQIEYLERAMGRLTRLPSLGGGRMTVADLNGDGWEDLAIANVTHGWSNEHFPLFIYWGSADGFAPERRGALPTLGGVAVAAADLDQNGRVDLVVANAGREHRLRQANTMTRRERSATIEEEESLSYIYWNGETGFSERERQAIATEYAIDVKAADLNGNGLPDLIFFQGGEEGTVRIYFNGRTGFSDERRIELNALDPTWGAAGREVLVADLDGNGWPDIFVPSAGAESLIHWNNEGEFERSETIEAHDAFSAAAGDLDGDGFVDLAIANHARDDSYATESYLYWGGGGGFSPGRRTELPTMGATSVRLSDVDRDGFADILFTNSQDGRTYDVDSYLYFGGEDGYRSFRREALATFGAIDAAVFDTDADGLDDIVFVNKISGRSGGGSLDAYVYWGNSSAVYGEASRSRLPPVRNEAPLVAGDLTGNGHADFVYTIGGGETLKIVYGEERAVSGVREIDIGYSGRSVLLADVDRDGFLDIVVGSGSTDDLAILYGSAEGHGAIERLPGGLPHYGSAVGDVNGDGRLDLVMAGFYEIRLLLSDADGGFGKGKVVDLDTGVFTAKVGLADLNGNGWLDLVAFRAYDRETFQNDIGTVIFWSSEGSFSLDNSLRLESYRALHGSIADLTGDGNLEIIVSNYHGGSSRDVDSYIYYPDDDSRYHERLRDRLQAYSSSANVVMDLDGDGYKDIVLYNHSYSNRHAGAGMRGGVHGIGSYIYWGSPDGHSLSRRSWFPSFGPHNRINVDPGDVLRRRDYEVYVSPEIEADIGRGAYRFEVTGSLNRRQRIRLFVRSWTSGEQADDLEWTELQPEETQGGTIPFPWEPASRAALVQYKLHLDSGGTGTGPVVRAVSLRALQ